ncbi:phosphoribosyltransferase family protein [Nocardioides daeguensis]|uniref:Phosphoribosyltransferase family protein n=1 Tax=Nocardioides daeguensis TaxID=908359 RepID=A0ABP6UTJ4_9ACTN|nr:phosphoribosyltransferase family protein [Nocardioides daeguensis]MBV6728342.1 dienelactone hydrolase family protein [Nocardioides daeguensis]MCR1773151.1 dienelactone hydrolase family protein [Nocardioides daeguensis]
MSPGTEVTFADRADAGRQLAQRLRHLRGQDVVVLGLPRGGVPVALEVARELRAPLDVIVVRKLGLPFQPEVAMGAIGEGGYEVLDRGLIARTGVTDRQLELVEARERAELQDRVRRFRPGREPADLTGRTAVIVDDGIATGATAAVACQAARHLGATRVLVAVPVGPAGLRRTDLGADDVVVVQTPDPFWSVGQHYRDFAPTTDDEVVRLVTAEPRVAPSPLATQRPGYDADVELPLRQQVLRGHLHLPADPRGIVVFAHGSGSSRHSSRNQYVARVLREAGLGTLLLDLLTPEEEQDRDNVFDVALLAGRVAAAVRWLRDRPDAAAARIGLFGASTGAAAALGAAADPGLQIAAVVSRGGRPDLAGPHLRHVTAPTLLVVGGADTQVLRLNQLAADQLGCVHELRVVPRATHLFEEPGALREVAHLARDWFSHYLLAGGTERSAPLGVA